MVRSAAVLFAFLLVGCAAQSENREAELTAQDGARCQAHGYKPGSADYDQCLTDLENQRTRNDRAALMGRLQGRSPMLN